MVAVAQKSVCVR